MHLRDIKLDMLLYLHENPGGALFYFLEVALFEFLQPNPVALNAKARYYCYMKLNSPLIES